MPPVANSPRSGADASGHAATNGAAPALSAAATDQTGLLLLADNLDAFAARALAARVAQHSLDLMYYIWRDDHTGRLLTHEVIKAADRGVRVRMLLDDSNPRSNDATYLALDSHPNIALRLFNPSWARTVRLLRGLEFVLRFFTMTRRMHNKAWIADGNVAILGGRNIGDEYFDAADTNFRDLDVLLVGKAVAQTSDIFASFWNSAAVKPIRVLNNKPRSSRSAFKRFLFGRPRSPLPPVHVSHVDEQRSMSDLIGDGRTLHWTDKATVISDPPEKAVGRRRRNWLMQTLLPIMTASRTRLEIVSPYFIPGAKGVASLADLVRRNVKVSVLTNSLAATDVAAVHGAYANYRRRLLRAGVRLFELQPYARSTNMSVFGSKGASLHTKAFTVDETLGFIGSLNFDPRSASLNTEMGVLFEHPQLVSELRRCFKLDASIDTSYRLYLEKKALRWEGQVDGVLRRFSHEPEASLSRRL
ncbi:MAG: phospholipase D family protein, partial [Mesorhizobium sp.]|nr:phospholipase D family protein [Mesorhizobium sp.]